MKFCKECDNMYYIKLDEETQNKLIYYCRKCGHEESNLNEHVVVSKSNTKKNNEYTFVNKYTKLDPTIPRINTISCINDTCPSNKENVPKDILYIRYNNEALKYVYICSLCDTMWNNQN